MIQGFTDSLGNVQTVQGAGTVYNEELNSFAIGKDTIASGREQFAFGRMNVQDNNKVEVVGGGGLLIQGKQYKTTAGTNLTFIGNSKNEADLFLANHGCYFYLETLPDGYSIEDINFIFSSKNNDLYSYFWLVLNDGKWFFANQTAHSNHDKYTGVRHELANCVTYVNGYINISALINYTTEGIRYNIRTLDWEGNESLAGNLEISGDYIKIGQTSITEVQLKQLLALINAQLL